MHNEDKVNGIDRRGFLAGAASVTVLGALAGIAGCAPNTAGSATTGVNAGGATDSLPAAWDLETEVLVVGGGGGGLVAALKAKELGAAVILLEKAERVGGDTALSSQAAQGFWVGRVDADDTVERYLEDLKNSHWATEKGQAGIDLPQAFPLTQAWLDICSAMYDWTEAHGMAWVDVTTAHEAWYPQPQWDTGKTRQWAPSGGSLIAVLQDVAEDLSLDIKTSTAAFDLITNDDGRVVGVWALDENEHVIAIKASKAVILANGGFNANRGMMARYLPAQGTGYCGGCDQNTGDGHMMVKAIGGKLNDMRLGTHWMVYDDVSSTTLYNGAVMAYGGNAELADAADFPFLLVNYNGERFMAETMGYKWVGYHTNNQPFHMNYFVFDSSETCTTWFETAAARFGGTDKLKVFSAATLDELAGNMQVPSDALTTSVERYNGFVDAGIDEDFGRSLRKVTKLETPPFRALRMRPRHYTTYGGVAIDTSSRVLDEKDEVIPGLYAAGTVSGALVEQEGLYYQGGVGQTLSFGYLAATKAVEEEPWK